MSDTAQSTEIVIIAVLIVSYAVAYLLRRLRRSRSSFSVGLPVAVGVALRFWAIAGISATGLSSTLRGGDETTFLGWAHILASEPLGRGYWPHGPYQLHTVLFALELKLGSFTEGALRIMQVGLATLGAVLILAAVYDLAGPRAARLAAWLLAFEPASIFFNSALHKEPLMTLASGLVVFGGTKIWRRLDPLGIFLCALGGLMAIETRSYAGWFLVSASVLVLLHAALRHLNRPLVAMPMIYLVAIVAFVATPVVLQASSKQSLQTLQQSQTANTSTSTQSNGANGNNLALEQVNFSTRGAVIANLPTRMRDLVLRPYPWQLGDASQRFGAVGTLIAWTGLLMLIRYLWRNRGKIFATAGPILYPLSFLLIAYSLSVGNAGTGFRYRTHIVELGLAMLVVLREHALRARESSYAQPAPAAGDRQRATDLAPVAL